jgi:YfiH family protein
VCDPRIESPDLLALRRQVGRAAFAFSGRAGGVSAPPFASLNLGMHVGDRQTAVCENRRRMLEALGVASRRLAEAEQVHGAQVAVVTDEWLRDHAGGRCVALRADALVTSAANAVLSLYFADCVPIFLAAPSGRAIGLVHAGWRGTAKGVAAEAVRVMCREFGLKPSEIAALIGPCVRSCCYEVGEDVRDAVCRSLPPTADASEIGRPVRTPGHWMLDLAPANLAQLHHAGVPHHRVEVDGRCTCCNRATFFSVRGDGSPTGRCGAFAYMLDCGC